MKNPLSILFLFYLFSTTIIAQSNSLIVIDSEFSKKNDVLSSIPSGALVLELDKQSNPWKVIRERMETNNEIKTIHLFTNASYNALQMGGITYDINSLQSEFELSMLEGLYQGVNLQLLIYNCNLGSNDEGVALLNEIGELSYMNVGVCTNCTSIFEDTFTFNYTTIDQAVANSILQK